jgi:hypothetical protein
MARPEPDGNRLLGVQRLAIRFSDYAEASALDCMRGEILKLNREFRNPDARVAASY